MDALFVKLLNMSAAASILIAVIIVLRLLLRKAPKKYICLLWAIAALRLIAPVSISSAVSAYNYLGSSSQNAGEISFIQYRDSEQLAFIPYAENTEIPIAQMPAFNANVSTDAHRMNFYLPTAMGIWAFGVAAMLCCAGISYLRLKKQTAEAVRFRRNIYRCDHLPSPFILGIVKPKIYLPSELNETQRQSVIAHEQAHIRRLDHWWKPIGYLILSIHWFNPLVWVGYALLSRDIETACDERVISAMSSKEKQNYSETLLQCSMPQKFISACPLAFGETGVKQRIKGILNYRKPTAWIVALSLVICMCAGAAFLTDPIQAETHSPAARYTLQIADNDVAYISIESPSGTSVCRNADGSLFQKGELVWLEALDGVENLSGVTFCAYDANDAKIWQSPIPDKLKDAAVIDDQGWCLRKENAENEQTGLIGYNKVQFGALSCTIPAPLYYVCDTPGAATNASILLREMVVGGIQTYPMDIEKLHSGIDWINDVDFPEWQNEQIGFKAGTISNNPYYVEFFDDPTNTNPLVRNIHNLYYQDGLLYDLWFDDLAIGSDDQAYILATVAMGEASINSAGQLGVVATVETVNVRSGPGATFSAIATLKPGAVVNILETEVIGDQVWGRIGDDQWICMAYIAMSGTSEYSSMVDTTFEEVTVSEGEIPLYSSPSTTAPAFGILYPDAEFTIRRIENVANKEWYYIHTAYHTGWVEASLLGEYTETAIYSLPEKVENEETQVPDDAIALYLAPSQKSQIVGYMNPGEEITVKRRAENADGLEWYYISCGEQTGWAEAALVDEASETAKG